jgi:hypothetical protein
MKHHAMKTFPSVSITRDGITAQKAEIVNSRRENLKPHNSIFVCIGGNAKESSVVNQGSSLNDPRGPRYYVTAALYQLLLTAVKVLTERNGTNPR